MEKLIESILHNIPFMALMSVPQAANRPLATKLSEQLILVLATSFISGSFMLWVSNDRQDEKIKSIMEVIHDVKIELNKVREVERDVAVNKAKIAAIEHRNDTKDALDEHRNNAKPTGQLNNGH